MKKDKLRKIVLSKLTYVLVMAIFFAILSVYGLRSNYSTMVELREAVIVADQNDGDIEAALQKLREHVHGHMNTDLSSGDYAIKPPIQLKARFERLMTSEQARVKSQNEQVAAVADAICGQKFPAGGFNTERVVCIQDYVATQAVKETAVADDLYKFDFVSPRWSPDRAGIPLLIAALLSGIFIIGLAVKLYTRHSNLPQNQS